MQTCSQKKEILNIAKACDLPCSCAYRKNRLKPAWFQILTAAAATAVHFLSPSKNPRLLHHAPELSISFEHLRLSNDHLADGEARCWGWLLADLELISGKAVTFGL